MSEPPQHSSSLDLLLVFMEQALQKDPNATQLELGFVS
jgi:hypothetical protein